MSWNTLILILVVAAVAYFVWKQRGGKTDALPAAAAAGAGVAGSGVSSTGPAASYDEYRRRAPSNMINGKLTCTQCGSNLISVGGGTASCSSCGTALYRA